MASSESGIANSESDGKMAGSESKNTSSESDGNGRLREQKWLIQSALREQNCGWLGERNRTDNVLKGKDRLTAYYWLLACLKKIAILTGGGGS